MESILTSVKTLLGLKEEVTHFDTDIILFINSALMSANMIGLGSGLGFSITDKTATWSDFLGDRHDLAGVKTYIGLKVKLVFDPPQMGYLVESIKEQIAELEWRLNAQAEYIGLNDEPVGEIMFTPIDPPDGMGSPI